MHVAVGVALGIFGAALMLWEARFFRDEDELNERVGGRASRLLGQIQFLMFGAILLIAGLLLIFRKG